MLSRAQGNPYFLAELLHLLVDRGLLLRDGDGWVASGPLPDAALPAAVQSVLAARIDGLDPEAKSVLRAASVLGIRFAAQALPVVDQRPEVEVASALEELTRASSCGRPGRVSCGGPSPIRWPATSRTEACPSPTEPAAMPGPRCGLPKARGSTEAQVDTFIGTQAEQA